MDDQQISLGKVAYDARWNTTRRRGTKRAWEDVAKAVVAAHEARKWNKETYMDIQELCQEALEAVVNRPGEESRNKAMEAISAIRAKQEVE